MKVVGTEGLSNQQVWDELQRGAKFVIYQYCISILILTFKRPSNIHFIRSGENAIYKGLPYSLISLFLGWWGIPWGPIYGSIGFAMPPEADN
jgi:hypothetical protein